MDSEVAKIISVSRVNNKAVKVTGLLLVIQDVFLQVLEGEATAVQTTYGRILHDPRHADAQVLKAEPVTQRSFGQWNMCSRRLNHGDTEILDTLKQRGVFEPRRLTPQSALGLLASVAQIQLRHAAAQ